MKVTFEENITSTHQERQVAPNLQHMGSTETGQESLTIKEAVGSPNVKKHIALTPTRNVRDGIVSWTGWASAAIICNALMLGLFAWILYNKYPSYSANYGNPFKKRPCFELCFVIIGSVGFTFTLFSFLCTAISGLSGFGITIYTKVFSFASAIFTNWFVIILLCNFSRSDPSQRSLCFWLVVTMFLSVGQAACYTVS